MAEDSGTVAPEVTQRLRRMDVQFRNLAEGIGAILPNGEQRLVLVVEDDPTTGEFLSHMLEVQSGYRVLLAENIREALDLVQNPAHQIYAMFLDLALGIERGEDLLLELQKRKVMFPRWVITGADITPDLQNRLRELDADYLQQKSSSEVIELQVG